MWDIAENILRLARRFMVLGSTLAVMLPGGLSRAYGLDPGVRISQYAHTAWRIRDGAFNGEPSAVAQTTDGYIWIGTVAGLLRFDGVRFVPFSPAAGEHLPNPAVFSLLGGTDGSLWIGTGSGLSQWKDGHLRNFPETAGRINYIYEDHDGTIWIARSRTNAGGVCKVAASAATCYRPQDGVPPHAGALIRDNLGYFLIGTDAALVRWKPGSSTAFELPALKSEQGLSGVGDLALAPDGSVWVGIYHSGNGLGLQRWLNGSWKTFVTPTFEGSKLHVNSLRLDRNNTLWVATEGAGLYRIHDGTVDHFTAADGLSSDSVEYSFEDKEGNLWLTTAEGVDCFRTVPVVSFSTHEGLTANKVESILAARDGTVWIGNNAWLDFVRGNVISSIGPKSGFHPTIVTSLFEDDTGQLWVGMGNGLFIYKNGSFASVNRSDGSSVGIVLAMAEDTENNVWASVIRTPPGRPTKLICFRDGKFIKEISDLGLDIVSMTANPQGGLWLGLRHGGLVRYRNEQAQSFPLRDANAIVNQVQASSDGSVLAATTTGLVEQRDSNQLILDAKNGLPCDRIFTLITDKHSDLWLYAECGLIKVTSQELARWRAYPDLKITFDLFDAFDGAQPYIPPFRPIATRSPDGRLWFANETVAQMIDPDGQLRNPIPPPVHVEEVIADRKTYSAHSGLRLPALTRDLQIDYTALSFVVPQKVKFQYKLEGYDRDWQDAGTRRQAFYSNLPPRHYTFRVKACNNSGVWNEAGASLDFFVLPAYYQANWFRMSCVALFIALLWALHRWRVHRLEDQEKRLRGVVETIPAMTFTGSSDGACTFVNKRWTEYTGLSIDQTSGTGWRQAIHPEDVGRHSDKWKASVATGQPFEDEVRLRRALDGAYRWFLVRAVPLRNRHGNISQWYGTLTDIEDRKGAEGALQLVSQDLRESKDRLEEAQCITHVGYWIWDLETNRLTWPDETYRIFGLRPQERPIDVAGVLAMVHPEDLNLLRRMIEAATQQGAPMDLEFRIIRPDGDVRILHHRGGMHTEAPGSARQRFGTVQDITEQKRAEEALQRSQFYISEGQRLANMGSWAFNPAGFFDYWSDELFQIYGLDPQEGAPTLERYLATLHPQDREAMAETIRTMNREHCGCDVKKRIVRPDGAQRYIRCVGIPVVKDGVLKGFLGTAMDITEQEQLTRELERRQSYLALAQRLSQTGSFGWHVPTSAIYWSEETFRIFEFDTATKPSIDLIEERTHPDDRLLLHQSIDSAALTRSEIDVEHRLVMPNGAIKFVRMLGHPSNDESGSLEYRGVFMDITGRKRSEEQRERLRQLETDLAHINRVSTLGEMAASLAHEIKQPIAAAITSANSCVEWLAHEPPNLDRARAAASRIEKYGNRAAEIIDRIRSFYRKSSPQREVVDVNGIIHEMFTLLHGEATRSSVVMRTDLATELPSIMADRVQLQQVFMNLMLNAIEAMQGSGGELTVESKSEDGHLLFSVSDTGVGLPTGPVDHMFSAFFTTKSEGSGMGLTISRSIVESHGGRLWATANDGHGASFHFTLPTRASE